ncbi:hypothetical protein RYJ27_06065 [Microbacterium limosum]|uniref:Resolvase/invertase-type recombinase catalytic domain-containing protein n=1 Tax=Microbacterium limosum TaxID=3079935 RepID=A0AAU0MKR3_9MICO|nr:hypothetical protein [Microbacterium sp. Y20]WOQ70752.1 hypothetical protein RYJ27_06065 [Microbacterium sp. Y20]
MLLIGIVQARSPSGRFDAVDGARHRCQQRLAFYNEAYGVSLKLSDLSGKDRIVARITRKIGKEFNHGHVAAVFLRNLDRSIQGLSVATLERFEQVIEALVRALPAE